MAIKKIPVPFCDVCLEPWLPKHRLADGTINPVFLKPELGKRCGKCKRTGWNAGGIDRRRKPVEPADLGDGGCTERLLDEGPQILEPQELPKERQAVATANRCRHGLYSCPQCHPEKAA